MYHLIQGVHEHQDVYKSLTSPGMYIEHILCEHDTTQYTLALNDIPYIPISSFMGQHRSNPFGVVVHTSIAIHIIIILIYTQLMTGI